MSPRITIYEKAMIQAQLEARATGKLHTFCDSCFKVVPITDFNMIFTEESYSILICNECNEKGNNIHINEEDLPFK